MAARVVLTGLGVVSPAGAGWKEHGQALLGGESLVRRLADGYASFERVIGAPAAWDGPHEQPRYVEMATAAVGESLAHAGLDDPADRASTAVIGATAIAATVELETAYRRIQAAPGLFTFDSATQAVRQEFGLAGMSWTLTTGCTAGLDALGLGYDVVASGHQPRAVVFASDATLSPIVVAAFARIGALSRRPCAPDKASSPFAVDRDGFVLGEGAAALLLEDAAAASARGAGSVAELCGWASVSSAFHMTGLQSDGRDVARAISDALDAARVSASDVDAVDAHGTSTPLNDTSEAAAIRAVFGTRGGSIPVTAQKGVMGHALGASNLLEVAGLTYFLSERQLAPVANTTMDTLDCPLDVVMTEPRPLAARYVVKVSSGFSGIHTACVLKALA
jgi:3-oxoacyl-(acyl-carrier-protein) synthase